MSIYEILDYLYLFFFGFIFVPLGVGLFRWKSLNLAGRIAMGFLASVLVIEVLKDTLSVFHIRNHFMYYPHTVVVFAFSTWFFYKMAGPNVVLKKWLIWTYVAIILFLPLEVWVISGFNQINTITQTLSYLNMIGVSGYFLKELLLNKRSSVLSQDYRFWFCAAFFTLSLFSVVTSFFKKQFIESSLDLYYFFDMLTVIGGATAFILFAIGFIVTPKK